MGMRRRLSSQAALVVGGATLVVGCSPPFGADGGRTESAGPEQTVASAPPAELLTIGEWVEWQGARTSVTAARRPFGGAPNAPAGSGREWLGLRAVTCAGDVPVEAAWYLFAAHGPSSERYPAPAWDEPGWPRPQYPEGTVDPGECVDGWVLIPVVVAAPVATVRLSDPDGIPLGEWRLPEEVGG
jgi:hypothetical protein